MKRKLISLLLLVTQIPLMAAMPFEQVARQGPPETAYISGVIGHPQTYNLSCESRSAVDIAAYWGATISETDFFNSLDVSDNPNKGFVGSVHGTWGQTPPNPYGVHAEPIAETLRDWNVAATAQTGMSFESLQNEIAAGHPVLVWVIGGVWAGTAKTYTDKAGDNALVAAFEHTYVVIGYDKNYMYMIDAGNGATQTHTISAFKSSWGVLNNMAVTVSGLETSESPTATTAPSSGGDPAPAPSATPVVSGTTYIVKSGDFLKSIADAHGTTWQTLASLNGISFPYIIIPGQKLIISAAAASPTATPAPTKTPAATTEPAATAAPTAVPTPSDAGVDDSGSTYTVKRGDHLMQIARTLELNWIAMAALNNLSSPYILQPGQVLKLPGKDAGAPPAPTTGNTNTSDDVDTSSWTNTYVVKGGDYLYALAREMGINWQTLAAANKVSFPYIIYPGQTLKVP